MQELLPLLPVTAAMGSARSLVPNSVDLKQSVHLCRHDHPGSLVSTLAWFYTFGLVPDLHYQDQSLCEDQQPRSALWLLVIILVIILLTLVLGVASRAVTLVASSH